MQQNLVKKTRVFFRDREVPWQIPGLLNAIGYDGARPRRNQPSSFWLREGHRLEEILYDVHILYRKRVKQIHSDVTGGSDDDIKYLNLVYQRIKKTINGRLQPKLSRPPDIYVPIVEMKPCHCGCGKGILTSKAKPFFNEECRKENQRRIWRKSGRKREMKTLDKTVSSC